MATTLISEASVQESGSIVTPSAAYLEKAMFVPNTPEEDLDGGDASSASTSSKMEEICVRQKMMQRLAEAQVDF